MQSINRIAFKEWAAVCLALASGRQSIILRKGGIHEGRDGFHVLHRQYWLFPTQFHQDAAQLTADAAGLVEQSRAAAPRADTIALAHYFVVGDVHHVTDHAALDRLGGLHVLSAGTLEQRFRYRQPGLFVLVGRTYTLPQPHVISEQPYFAGCRSWVELPDELPTAGAQPALTDEQFAAVRERVRLALYGEEPRT